MAAKGIAVIPLSTALANVLADGAVSRNVNTPVRNPAKTTATAVPREPKIPLNPKSLPVRFPAFLMSQGIPTGW